jgi:hypothetical protein
MYSLIFVLVDCIVVTTKETRGNLNRWGFTRIHDNVVDINIFIQILIIYGASNWYQVLAEYLLTPNLPVAL